MAAEMYAQSAHKQTVWRGLYLRLAIQTALLTGFLPFTALSMYLAGDAWFFLVVPYLLMWLAMGYLLSEWKCPGCLRSYLKRGQYGLTFPGKLQCVNCGLAVGEERNPEFSARGAVAARNR
ncbi:MAG: hypothetical protein JSS95_08285 [Acidobacteria bacterium]|nr:hypothetical protein [Acidobacteriota bacterium]